MAQRRYEALVQKLKGPKNKRDILDVLEYQHMREQQVEQSRAFMEAYAAQIQKEKQKQEEQESEKSEKKE